MGGREGEEREGNEGEEMLERKLKEEEGKEEEKVRSTILMYLLPGSDYAADLGHVPL